MTRLADSIMLSKADQDAVKAGVKTSAIIPYKGQEQCPLGDVGRVIFMKEAFYALGRWDWIYDEDRDYDRWHFTDQTQILGQKYRETAGLPKGGKNGLQPGWIWRNAQLMPKEAARTFLEITGVRELRVFSDAIEGWEVEFKLVDNEATA